MSMSKRTHKHYIEDLQDKRRANTQENYRLEALEDVLGFVWDRIWEHMDYHFDDDGCPAVDMSSGKIKREEPREDSPNYDMYHAYCNLEQEIYHVLFIDR